MSKTYKIDSRELVNQAAGRWLDIFTELCPEWEAAVSRFQPGSRKTPPKVTCPVHGGKSGKNFGLMKDGDRTGGVVCNSCGVQSNGISALMWAKQWSFYETLKAVHAVLLGSGTSKVSNRMSPKVIETKDDPKVIEELTTKMSSMWGQAYPLIHENAWPAQRYLENRGLCNIGDLNGEVVFHPSVAYWQKEEINGILMMVKRGYYPCLLSTVRDPNGRPVNIHRTYLNFEGGKAPFENVKKMMEAVPGRPVNGGSIKLMPPSTVVGVAEGLETTLAALSATLLPVECLVNTTLMRSWEPRPMTKKVFIFQDKDRSRTGENAAVALEQRLVQKQIEVERFEPDLPLGKAKSVDWADVLKQQGVCGFPQSVRRWRDSL